MFMESYTKETIFFSTLLSILLKFLDINRSKSCLWNRLPDFMLLVFILILNTCLYDSNRKGKQYLSTFLKKIFYFCISYQEQELCYLLSFRDKSRNLLVILHSQILKSWSQVINSSSSHTRVTSKMINQGIPCLLRWLTPLNWPYHLLKRLLLRPSNWL